MNGRKPNDPTEPRTLKTLIRGRGEDAMRMEKRLRCAGRALGVGFDIHRDTREYGTMEVWIGDRLLVDHLVETTALEVLLKPLLSPEQASHES